jgi:hypothetical protein
VMVCVESVTVRPLCVGSVPACLVPCALSLISASIGTADQAVSVGAAPSRALHRAGHDLHVVAITAPVCDGGAWNRALGRSILPLLPAVCIAALFVTTMLLL